MTDIRSMEPEYPQEPERDNRNLGSDGIQDVAGSIRELVEETQRDVSDRRRDSIVYLALVNLVDIVQSQQNIIGEMKSKIDHLMICRDTQVHVNETGRNNFRSIIDQVTAQGAVADGLKEKIEQLHESRMAFRHSLDAQISINNSQIQCNRDLTERMDIQRQRMEKIENMLARTTSDSPDLDI